MTNLLIFLLVIVLSIIVGVYYVPKNKNLVQFNDNVEVRYFNKSDPPNLLFE